MLSEGESYEENPCAANFHYLVASFVENYGFLS